MEPTLVYTSIALSIIFLITLTHRLFPATRRRLPPTPSPAIPILGHLHLLRRPLHRTFHNFSQTHGPIFSLNLGFRRLVVVSSAALAAECSSTPNDAVLSNRPHALVDEHIGYSHSTMGGAPYGRHWRNLRRMASEEVLSPARLSTLSHIRQDEMRRTARNLISRDKRYAKVALRPILFEFIFNAITRMLAGKRYEKENEKFREMVSEVLAHGQSTNPEDFLPFLRRIDYRGLDEKMGALGKKLDEFYQGWLDEHRSEKRNTIIGHLLSLQQFDPEFYTDRTIKGFLSNMIIAGTDTTSGTIEWAMALLLNHPQTLEKLRSELNSRVGPHRLLEEQDLPNLPYLRNVILETLRLFPPAPLNVPRESSDDCKIGGYDVPRETILLVNVWAIQRDPKVWAEPARFEPERHLGERAESQKLMAFGMGRRACPGAGLGQRLVGLGLGTLVQCFDWDRVGVEEVDLAEGDGLTMPKLEPLVAMCRPREGIIELLGKSVGIYSENEV